MQNFELGLRNLYLKVQDYQQVLAASPSVTTRPDTLFSVEMVSTFTS